MFRLLLSHAQALLRYRSLITYFKMHCVIPNAYTFHKVLVHRKMHVQLCVTACGLLSIIDSLYACFVACIDDELP